MAFNFPDLPQGIIPLDIADLPLKHWDNGVFNYELIAQRLVSKDTSFELLQHLLLSQSHAPSHQLSEGTYAGTQLALTEAFDRIGKAYDSWLNVLGLESNIPHPLTLDEKKKMYTFQAPGKDRFPPHADTIPTKDQVSKYEIFDRLGLVQASFLVPKIVPKTLISQVSADITYRFREWMFGDPEQGFTIAEIEQKNSENRKSGTDIMRGANIGDLDDWHTDSRFAQQYLTGTNPMSIQQISEKLLTEFRQAAADQELGDMCKILEDTQKSVLYVVDHSSFREALGLGPNDPIILKSKDGSDPIHYGCAPVTLFNLNEDGDLHPLAIVLDYRSTMSDSVTLFNTRTSPGSERPGEEWSWRYAKTAVQSTDWSMHEVVEHLTDTHLVEEAIIVATQRTIPFDNIIFQLLEPHWFRTLSLNASARETLVPQIIFQLVAYDAEQGANFIQHSYRNFDFQARYVPRHLQDRGSPIDELGKPRFKN